MDDSPASIPKDLNVFPEKLLQLVMSEITPYSLNSELISEFVILR